MIANSWSRPGNWSSVDNDPASHQEGTLKTTKRRVSDGWRNTDLRGFLERSVIKKGRGDAGEAAKQ
jgi:hypothetical protein